MQFSAKLLRWGSSYGIRIRKQDVERLGLEAGHTYRIEIPDFTEKRDVSSLPSWPLGGLSAKHDDGFEEL